ncbi:MAG TPA: 2-oxoglutarate dehydrogenase complex dihydrolipoyllysine-residue succinyltransferase [Thermomicrobiales bacterium]|nr:2-oxoglutarate dehydrogenase complex dihydrolipoyllysine-residue succinyltransferase [Thermomicrobiales bacterium]
MPVEIRVPPLGESLVDAVVGQWLKGEGDQVSRGETIVELETDKVNLDVTAPEDGVLGKIERNEGDVVTVGELLGTVSEGAGAAANGAAPQETVVEIAAPFAEPVSAAAASVPQTAPAPAPEPATVGDGGRAAPAVRMLASEHSVDLNAVEGTGPGGRVTREDVLAAVARNLTTPPRAPEATPQVAPPAPAPASQPVAPAPAPVPAPMVAVNGREERVRMSRRRQTIAARLVEAQQTAAMLTTFNEIDMTAIMELRAARKDAFKEKHGVGLGFMSFFTKAVVGALKAFPRVNAEIQGDEMVLKHYYDIGIAVGTDEGLVVPVVRDADRKTFAEIEKNIGELAVKARDGKLEISDLTGGTFTITNGGIYGSLLSTPILNAPQSGILGMHAIQQRPVAKNGEVVIRPMMYVALSYDHRIVDGSEAVRFLVRVKELAEDPTNLLLEG